MEPILRLPDLNDVPNFKSKKIAGLSRGGHGQMHVSVQSVLVNLHDVFRSRLRPVLVAMELNPRIKLNGFVSHITGIRRTTVSTRMRILTFRDNVPKKYQCRTGRKRKMSTLRETASQGSMAVVPPLPVLTFSETTDALMELPDDFETMPIPAVTGSSIPSLQGIEVLRNFESELACQVCPYQGLHVLSAADRNTVVGLRLASLSLRLETTSGAGVSAFPKWIAYFDQLFPGECGQLCHGKNFADKFLDAAVQSLEGSAPLPLE